MDSSATTASDAAARLQEAARDGVDPAVVADSRLAAVARDYIDERRIRHPLNRFLTLDGRVAPREWDDLAGLPVLDLSDFRG